MKTNICSMGSAPKSNPVKCGVMYSASFMPGIANLVKGASWIMEVINPNNPPILYPTLFFISSRIVISVIL